MTEHACRLSRAQRAIVEATIRKHCELRGWILHEVNCRSNHLHLVVSAPVNPKTVRSQLKAYCTRMLRQDQAERSRRSAREQLRKNWWAERGSIRYLNDEDSLEAAILYVRHGQDRPRPPH
jgi:REP element-mobilizing transposase RayT